MAIDDILKGLSALNEGVTQLATTNAVRDANQQLQTLNAQQQQGLLNDKAALAAHSQLAQSLAMRLQSAGADAAHIQTVVGQLAPSQGAQYEAGVNSALQDKSQAFQSGESAKQRAFQHQENEANREAMLNKASQKDLKETISSFGKSDDIKKIVKAAPDLDASIALLQQYKNLPGNSVPVNLAKDATLHAAIGRVTDQSMERINQDPSIMKDMANKAGLQWNDKYPQNVVQFWTDYLTATKQQNAQYLSNAIQSKANEYSVRTGKDSDRVLNALRAAHAHITGNVQATPAPGSAPAGASQPSQDDFSKWIK